MPRLFDLIKVQDESVLPAFYYAIRDTLVAKDMEQATRIAYGKTRFRVVTLGGQLIDLSGKTLNLFKGMFNFTKFPEKSPVWHDVCCKKGRSERSLPWMHRPNENRLRVN